MSFYFLDSTARAAWTAATTQQAQLEALAALWSGDVWAKFYSSAGTHLATVTYGTPTIDTGTTPRAMVLGAWSAEAHYNPGTATYCILQIPSGADILRADVSLAGAITDPGGRTRLDIGSKLRIEATSTLPATSWVASAVINEWMQIPDTDGYGGGGLRAYSGVAINGTELYSCAAGGHLDSSDNRVASIDLSADAPAWQTRITASSSVQANVAWYADGKPTSRHTYSSTHYVSSLGKVFLLGVKAAYGGSASDFPDVAAYDPATDTWSADGDYPDVTASPYFFLCTDTSGNAWTVGNESVWKWTASTQTSALLKNFLSGEMARCAVWDKTHDQLVTIGHGNGWGTGSTLNAYKISSDGQTRTALTLTGTDLTQFNADACPYPALDWDDTNACLYYYGCAAGAPGRVYKITPNSGASWPIEIVALGAGTSNPQALPTGNGGVNNRFRYVPALKGFVYVDTATGANISFLRTA